MTQRAWIAGLIAAGLVAALAIALWRPGAAAMADRPLATHEGPARLCARPAAAELEALRSGARQLVVVVQAFAPPADGGGAMVAHFIAAGDARHELGRFAVHPLRAFTSREPGRSQRFALPLTGVAHLLQTGSPVCVEVGFAAAAPHQGRAQIAIEIERKP